MLNKTHTKYIQSLQHKKFRDELGEFIAEGPKVVLGIIRQPWVCLYLHWWPFESWMEAHQKQLQNIPGPQLMAVKGFWAGKISMLTTAHQVLVVFKKKQPVTEIDARKKITLVLDGIQDPAIWYHYQNGRLVWGRQYCFVLATVPICTIQSGASTMGSLQGEYFIYPMKTGCSKTKRLKICGGFMEYLLILSQKPGDYPSSVMKEKDRRNGNAAGWKDAIPENRGSWIIECCCCHGDYFIGGLLIG